MEAAGDIQRIKLAYAGWNGGDIDAVLAFIAEDVVIRPVLGDAVSGDTFQGHDGVRHWFATIRNTLEDFRSEIEDVIDAGGRRYVVFARFSGRGAASGAEVTRDAGHFVTLGDDGLITAFEGYESREGALRAAGIGGGS
ncbi:MAG TPA: nuclear transport factor 2 family protein [Thermoleophilaceae bacterium]|jgi:ketosteroid isomerase-like protein